MTTLSVSMKVGGVPISVSVPAPLGPVPPRDLLPVFRAIAEEVVGVAVTETLIEGGKISCRKGCGACCRQVVPVAPVEAAGIAALVEAMPEPEREAVRERFRRSAERLHAAGLVPRLLGTEEPSSREEVQDLGLAYFRLGIPCPFLVDESCSIHPDRPIACREYLVTSPPAECSRPGPENVRIVPLARATWPAVAAALARPGTRRTPMVPLALALEYVEGHPGLDAPRSSEEVVGAFLRHLGSAPPRA